jgi:hypothetical protein
VGFVVDKVALGQVFSEYFGFPCQFSFHRLLHTHRHLSSGAGTIGQILADVPSDSVSPQETKKKSIMNSLDMLRGENMWGYFPEVIPGTGCFLFADESS